MINEALYALGIDGGWKIKNGKIAKWYSDQPQPTEAEIQAKIIELQAKYDANQYQRDRQPEYPSIQDQLDMQFWDKVNGTNNWQEAIEAVKTKHPKPE